MMYPHQKVPSAPWAAEPSVGFPPLGCSRHGPTRSGLEQPWNFLYRQIGIAVGPGAKGGAQYQQGAIRPHLVRDLHGG